MAQVPASAKELLDDIHRSSRLKIASGELYPTVPVWGISGALTVIALLLIDLRAYPRLSFYTRLIVWLAFSCYAVFCIKYTGSPSPGISYGIGEATTYMIILFFALLVCADPQQDHRRIKRHESTTSRPEHKSATKLKSGALYMQCYPDTIRERLDWVTDLVYNARGVGWTWRIPGLPALPLSIQAQFQEKVPSQFITPTKYRASAEKEALEDRTKFMKRATSIVVRNCFIFDLIQTIMLYDPYFWGVSGIPPPWPAYILNIRFMSDLIKIYRLSLCLLGLFVALQMLDSMVPLVIVGLIGSRRLGIRGEPWMWPDFFGSFRAALDRGLAGWWSGFWHQSFRYGLEAPGKKVVKLLGMNPRSTASKFLRMAIAFTLSGIMHAGGSYGSLGDSRPVSGAFRFFVAQIFGITFQIVATTYLRRLKVVAGMPLWLQRMVNVVYIHLWLYLTSPWLVDDLSVSRLWLTNLLPISPLRGLGLGPADSNGWLQWSARPVTWHTGDRWWKSGLVI